MAVKFSRTGEKEAKKVEVDAEEAALIQEMVDLSEELSAVADKVKRFEELKKLFASKADEKDGGKEATFKHGDCLIVYSKKTQKTEVTNKDKMILKLGQELFNEIAKVTLGDLKKYLSEDELSDFTEKKEGSRSLKMAKRV